MALVDSAFVQAMREGWVVMIDEVNTARDVALLSINATLDGRLTLYLAATGETVVASPGFAVLLAYNPGLVGATDIPDAWHSRFPATLEVTSNWAALAELGAPTALVTEAMRLDSQRIAGEDGLELDAAVPRHRIALADERARRRARRARVLRLQPPRAGDGGEDPGRRGGRRVPDARPGRLRQAAGLSVERHAEPARLPAGGDLMTYATRAAGRPAVFVQQLHRAAAQRGRLDPVYQDLSDHWTRVLQRLYPVWALIGPGLSDPGHIEIHSRTVYLDSESLLGPRAAIAAGALEQRAILRCFGVALHETLHAKHTKRWAIEHDVALSESENADDRQLAVDRRLLEEPRMEAQGVREFPADSLRGRFVRRALQAAVVDVILPAFAEQLLAGVLGASVSRDLASRAHVYLRARTHYGIIDAQALAPLQAIWRSVLGEPDLRALDDLYARLLWIPDGELERLDEAAREYRRIVGEPEPPTRTGGAAQGAGSGEGGEGAKGEGAGIGTDGGAAAGSLADALEQAAGSARADQLEQLDHDVDLDQVIREAAGRGSQPGSLGRGCGTGLPTGRMPDRGVDRPPYPDEVQHARRYANRLRQATHPGNPADRQAHPGRALRRPRLRTRPRRAGRRATGHHPPVARHPPGRQRRFRSRTSG